MAEKKKKTRVGSVIFRIVLIIIAGLTAGLGLYSLNASGLLGDQLPTPFGYGISVVLSPSMEPVLHTNDLVVVKKQVDYKTDDIIVFQDGSMLVIHRLISIDEEEETAVTKGDANQSTDEPIDLAQIKGKMVFSVPFIGVIFKYLKTLPGTLLVLALAIFLLYRSRQKERDKDREELDDLVEEIKRLRDMQNTSDDSTSSPARSEASANAKEEVKEDSSDPSDHTPEAGSEAADEENAVSCESAAAEVADGETEASADNADAEVDDNSESAGEADTEKPEAAESAEDADNAQVESSESAD